MLYFLDVNSYFMLCSVQCDNAFVGIYREHINDVKSKIVLGNKKSLDINIIPTKKDPTFGTGNIISTFYCYCHLLRSAKGRMQSLSS